MSAAPTTTEKIRGLPWSIAANAANTVFAQFTFFGAAFVLFLSELNISNTQIGFLLSLFPFLGLIALFIAPFVARFGYKRTFITFWTIRKFITALLLLVPWVLSEFGAQAAVLLISAVTFGFGLCRAIAETGYYPWIQEFVPDSMRGRYSASNNVVGSVVGLAAVIVASVILGLSNSLDRFMILFAGGVAFGFLAMWMYTHVPGGAPVKSEDGPIIRYRDLFKVVKDRNFNIYLVGIGILTVGTAPLYAFIPLFMQQQIGLSDSNIVLLQTAGLVGGLLSTHLLGWSADRYGGRAVMLTGIVLKAVLPIGWLLMPRHSPFSLTIALGIALFLGISEFAWAVGSGRVLFVNIVPTEQKSQYMAVYYASIGIIGGVSQFIGGGVLDLSAGISGEFLFIPLDPYLPLFIAGVLLPIAALFMMRNVQTQGDVGLGEYAGLFIHGNPLLALERVTRYYRARDERRTVTMTELLGQTHSPLTIGEMLEALNDPRFNVRFEAVISIARMPAHPRLTDALCELVSGTELALSAVAIWAIARIRDPDAIPKLEESLHSPYRSIRAQSARALGTLRVKHVAPLLLERLEHEEDKGLQMAYAAALGSLQETQAIDLLFDLLAKTENEGARMELALSLARMVGEEHHFIRLLRRMRSDPGTTAAQEIMQLKSRLAKFARSEAMLNQKLLACSEAFAKDDLQAGVAMLVELAGTLPRHIYTDTALMIAQRCAEGLQTSGTVGTAYIILLLHVLDAGLLE